MDNQIKRFSDEDMALARHFIESLFKIEKKYGQDKVYQVLAITMHFMSMAKTMTEKESLSKLIA